MSEQEQRGPLERTTGAQHSPPDEPLDQERGARELRGRARRGVKMLLARLLFVQSTSLVVGILLARWLGPAPFGRFAIATTVVSIFNLLGDLGLGAALIRSRDRPGQAELSAAFTVQLVAGCAVGPIALLLGPSFEHLVWGSSSASWIFGVVVVATLLVGPLRSISAVALEWELQYGRIIAIEIGEHLAYSTVALTLAYMGAGLGALAAAFLARAVTGATLAMLLSPWKPRLNLAPGRVKPLLSFGIAYQTMNVVYLVNSAVAPLLVGRYAGDAGLGLVLWAHGNAERPKPLLEIVGRVAFPSYSRLGATAEVLRSGFERTLHGSLLAVGLYGGVLAGAAPLAVSVLYTDLWLPGVPMLYVFIAVFPIVTLTILLDVALLARGHSGLVRNFHLVRGALFWSMAFLATRRWGVPGYALAYAGSMLGFSLVSLGWARLFVPVRPALRAALAPLASMALAVVASRAVVATEMLSPVPLLLLSGLAGCAAFLLSEALLDGRRLRETRLSFFRRA